MIGRKGEKYCNNDNKKKKKKKKKRRLIKCHKPYLTEPNQVQNNKVIIIETKQSSRSSSSNNLLSLILITILSSAFNWPALFGQPVSSVNFMFADMSNAIEDDELSKTLLDGSGTEEWNLSQLTTESQLAKDESQSQWKSAIRRGATKWLSPLKQQDETGVISMNDRSFNVTTTTTTTTSVTTNNSSEQQENTNGQPENINHEKLIKRADEFPMDGQEMEPASPREDQFISVVNNQSNIVFTEPIEDVINYSASERSLSSFTAGDSGAGKSNSSSSNQTTMTRYGWKSSHNNEKPIVSLIKLSYSNNINGNSNISTKTPRIMHLNEAQLNTTTELPDGHDKERDNANNRNKIYKSYIKMSGSEQGHFMIENSDSNGTAINNKMISYSPTSIQVTGQPVRSESSPEHRVVLTIASSPVNPQPTRKQAVKDQHQRTKMLRAPLVITQDQLRMIADSEDPYHHLPYRAHQKVFREEKQRPTTKGESFMFDASLLPMTMSLSLPPVSSSIVSASELVPQTESHFDLPPTPFETDFKKMQQTGERHQETQQHQQQQVNFMQTLGNQPNQQQMRQHPNELQYEPIVVETSPEVVSSSDGAGQAAAQASNSNEPIDNSSGGGNDGSSDNLDASQEPFELLNDESPVAEDESNVDHYDDSDEQSKLSNKNKVKTTSEKPTRLDMKNESKQEKEKQQHLRDKKQPQQQQRQQDGRPEVVAKNKQPEQEQELLVGPFKSESEAPATITLAGIVYQKSGSSSSLVKSAPSSSLKAINDHAHDNNYQKKQLFELASIGIDGPSIKQQQHQTLPTVGGANELPNQILDKYWPYTSLYMPPSSVVASSSRRPHQLASVSDILLGSMKSGELTATTTTTTTTGDGNPIRMPLSTAYTSSLDGGLRLSPFSFSPGALIAASSNTNNNHQALQGPQHLEFDFLNPHSELVTKMTNFKPHHSSSSMTHEAITSMLLNSAATSGSSSLSQQQQHQEQAAPVWASSSNKGEQYYLGSLNPASTDGRYHHVKHQDKTGPIVIVQKDVKPMKYHLLRAYLKLRRLLRPFEATYVFPNDPHSIMKRRQRSSRAINLKLRQKMARKGSSSLSPTSSPLTSLSSPSAAAASSSSSSAAAAPIGGGELSYG